METRILHLVTQDNQPYGSTRKCCERCGKWVGTMDGYTSGWTDNHEEFTREFADSVGVVRCVDVGI